MAPSIKTLRARLDVHTSHNPEYALESVRAALRAFERREINRDRVLHECNQALDGHGVESVPDHDSGRAIADYVNMGDTYACTILFSYRTARFYVCSWGDWYERSPECRAHYRREARAERG